MNPEFVTEAANIAVFLTIFLGPVLVLPLFDRRPKPTKTDRVS